ncbi:MAG: CRP-like cAMP-binding protein/polyferredoxin [Desulforhopalus sp.]|jgi:CRP-like cAMP-binding protein/polyferredoxin
MNKIRTVECKNEDLDSLYRSLLLRDVSTEDLHCIVDTASRKVVDSGEYVYRQGERQYYFYLVASGEVELTLHLSNGAEAIVGHIQPGGHFGETSLITNECHSINARALTDLVLLCFEAESFHTLLLQNKVIGRQLLTALAHRLRVSFQDHATGLTMFRRSRVSSEEHIDHAFFFSTTEHPKGENVSLIENNGNRCSPSTIQGQMVKAARRFRDSLAPVLLTGESGSGRGMVAYEICRSSGNGSGGYIEMDLRDTDFEQLDFELFGAEFDTSEFSQINQLGLFKRMQGGTVVFYNAEEMTPDLQQKMADFLVNGACNNSVGTGGQAWRTRVIFVCRDVAGRMDGRTRLGPALYKLVENNQFHVAPLREHRRDIPRLVNYYLKRFSSQYGKTITEVDAQTMGMFMNYDWPGNLTELASVLRRAVIIGRTNEPLNNQIPLGMPKSEGKWEFNLLRFQPVRSFFSSRLFPVLPRIIVGIFFFIVLATLFFGPANPEKNIGITLSWIVGWPLMLFSFFFLARTWCSICGLSVPGWLAQFIVKPERKTPAWIKKYSGWIMAWLCIFLFSIEICWNAYASPRLTGGIIFTIMLGSLLVSMLYKRRVWCRYICPLGAINALFAMPSILELRANTHVCMNQCVDHLCYSGDSSSAGCPMFRHPFLVDNNRDCILCGQCIKNCTLNSIHLNLRLAPQELWNQQLPRLADSFLVVSLAAIFYPFTVNQKYPAAMDYFADCLHDLGFSYSLPFANMVFFFLTILVFLGAYGLFTYVVSRIAEIDWSKTAATLGYGMIPLVLGAFMAAHLEILVNGLWLLPANLYDVFSIGHSYQPGRVISEDATYVLQVITVVGGLLATLYATQRILRKLFEASHYAPRIFVLLGLVLSLLAIAYLPFV